MTADRTENDVAPRRIRVYPDPQMWYAEMPEDWDSMDESARMDYIWEVGMDNQKFGFKYEESPK